MEIFVQLDLEAPTGSEYWGFFAPRVKVAH